ncbi:hypothetical protein Fcan01_23988 [Folsomia candida]|uniref:Uncharacterized protein n=1 Tax=Folsomia candida TaxID=158441 RepID=A0A226DAG0_FOLCA|nr:hypothetical protein Fcan01_23988 [Folsomia candida]
MSAVRLFSVGISRISSDSVLQRLHDGKVRQIVTGHDKHGCILLYRCIHILEKSYNTAMMHGLLPAMIFCSPAVQVVGLFVCISFRDELENPEFLVFPLMVLNAAINNIVTFTMAAAVQNASFKGLLAIRQKATKPQRQPTVSRELKSCSLMKIRVGEGSCLDRNTPLVIQTFCINQTVSLTVLRSSKV